MQNNVILLLAGVAVAAFAGSCSKNENSEPDLTPKNITLTAMAPQAIESSNEFGIELFTKVAVSEDKNLMFSPLSASTALTMLLNGCGGDTYTQLQGTLKYPSGMTISDINEAYKSLVEQLLNADPKVKLALANAIFYRTGFVVKDPFLNVMNNDYKAYIKGLDFSAPSALTTINKWASDNTNGKIPEVLKEISGQAVMFIMNALYFNGDWSYQFDKSLTQDCPFYPNGGSTVNVSTMNGEVGSKTVNGNGFKAIEMPYGRTNFTMIVIVPDETLSDFYPSFTPTSWDQLTTNLDQIPEFGKRKVFMPKFKFSYEKYLNDQLGSMGMVDAFIPFQADLSGISDASIYVSFVKQNTFVEVDEEGTEAAAVTTIGIDVTSMPSEPPQFVIDKSFIFAIRERTTNTLMFIGQVVCPEE
ncbi:MAG TPA: serpin family protein [Bacteroidales bacterium]|nr:serpin family protein [Bacteroidales bacterium]OQB61028.1 MAG: Serpin (serine protease inhibitor) [Bacteroidetes bacterium ADurb.Bin145]HOU03078.1 serpin family protein [Bacteroidales bacterium]HQG63988.1 serpin family protein [Bacteroidales bacterium]HQK68501.1 serpin family protein [Bacteroidales bacterium]